MEYQLVIYFFVIFIFLRGIFKDLKVLLFTILSLGIIYAYTYYSKTSTDVNIVDTNGFNKNNIHNYGNIIVDKKPLYQNNLRKLDIFKEELNRLDLDKQTKIEIFSNLKRYLEIYNNFEIYDYKKNYLDDLVSQKTKIYNMISSLNITYSTKDVEVHRLFKLVEEFLESYVSKFKNGNTYNFLEHPTGYEKNNFDLFL